MTTQHPPTHGATRTTAACPAHTTAMKLYGPQFQQNPAELYRQFRHDFGPVGPIELDGGLPAWLVVGYREIRFVTSNPELFARDTRRWHQWPDGIPENWSLLPFVAPNDSVMFCEGAEHQRRAGAISNALSAVNQVDLRFQCEQIADGLIDEFAGDGEADLMHSYAHRVPLLIAARLFGLPPEQTPALLNDMITALDAGDGAVEAQGRVAALMQQLLEHKRAEPGIDMPSRLIEEGLTDEEIVLDLLVVMAAAQQPTANWIGNTLRLMLTDDRFALSLLGGRSDASQALNEVLWEDTPTQNFIGRYATRATDLGGRRIQAGDMLVLGLAAANADPLVRPAPEAMARNHAQVSFGGGEHGCPYPAPVLAHVIAKAAVEVLLDRLPDVRLTKSADDLEWRESVWMRGLSKLDVVFTPVAATS